MRAARLQLGSLSGERLCLVRLAIRPKVEFGQGAMPLGPVWSEFPHLLKGLFRLIEMLEPTLKTSEEQMIERVRGLFGGKLLKSFDTFGQFFALHVKRLQRGTVSRTIWIQRGGPTKKLSRFSALFMNVVNLR